MSVWRSKSLWIIIAAGLAIRLVLAFAFDGTNHTPIEAAVAGNVRSWDWRGAYESGVFSWVYPPLFLPWLAAASWLSDVSGLTFHGLANLGPILADLGLALAVYVYLGRRGAGERGRLIGAALVMLGPSFIAVSGYQGQIDSVAILPAVLGLMVWEHRATARRGIDSGLLVGIGASVKTVPLLLVPALLGSARSWREGAKLAVAAITVPTLTLVPLWLAGVDLHQVIEYAGVRGWGGLSLVVDPGVGWHWMSVLGTPSPPHGIALALKDGARWITLLALTVYAGFVARYRPAAIDAAVLLWLTVYVFSPNFFLNYLVWGLPFFIMAGYLTEVAVLQLVLIAPTVAYYVRISPPSPPATTTLALGYVPFMIALWVFWVVATFTLARRIAAQRNASPTGIQAPLVNVESSTS
jgi:hypothetical protein